MSENLLHPETDSGKNRIRTVKQETFTHPSVWLAHRISYGETDAMGIVYYAEYFHIFERARDAIIECAVKPRPSGLGI